MQVAKNMAVSLEFKLTDSDGNVIDSTQDGTPFIYLHGHGNFFEALESDLEGKSAGDSFSAKYAAKDAYGERNEKLVEALPHDMFKDMPTPELGMQFHAQMEDGMRVVTVIHVDEERVVIDANHPLSGVDLTFDITVQDIREGTEEEISHGHIHAAGGCGSSEGGCGTEDCGTEGCGK